MTRKTYNKLIRDKIPVIITSKGHKPEVLVMANAAYRKALKAKMIEEAQELVDAKTKDEVLNELSDIEELTRAIAANNGISMQKVEQNRRKKLRARGGFKNKLLLKYVDEKY